MVIGTFIYVYISHLALFLLFIIPIVYQYRKKSKNNQSYNEQQRTQLPPGPSPWPLIGNLPELVSKKPTSRWIHLLMKELNTEIACIRFGRVHVIPITCPKIAQEVLRKQDAIFASRPASFAASLFSTGYQGTVVTPFGDQWKKMRRVLTSEIICPSRHNFLHPKRVEEADHLVNYVYNQCEGSKNVDIRITTRHYCGNVIRKLMFNKRYFGQPMPDGGPGADDIEHLDCIFDSLRYLYAFGITDYFPSLIGLDLDGTEKIVKEIFKTMNKFHDPIIDERIKLWREDGKKREVDDFLDVLISLKGADGRPLLTAEEIKAQTIEIITAAVDNPSNAVEWILAEMMNNPHILKAATDEIDRIVGKERLVQESDIPHLNYLKSCIREAFRLHPIAPFNVPHVSIEDTTVAGYFIPKGSHVLVSRLGLGRNPKIWDEPLKFNPERHLHDKASEVVLTEHDLRFISFSTGRRGCIASSLGTTMTVMLLARLLQGFTWTKPDDVSSINLSESSEDLFLAKPLVLHAEPRLAKSVYPST